MECEERDSIGMKHAITNKKIIIIILLTLICNIWLLFLTGIWWDDYASVFIDSAGTLWEASKMIGRPSAFLVSGLAKILPAGTYRIITLFLLVAINILYYIILSHIHFFSEEESFMIVLLYTALPFNYGEAMECIFPYTIGLFFFMLAFVCMIKWNAKYVESKFKMHKKLFFIG